MTEEVKKDIKPVAAAKASEAKNDRPAPRGYGAGKDGKKNFGRGGNNRRRQTRNDQPTEVEFDQKILDLARVTRVMAGGKRMRFRACLAIGNHQGKVGVGLAKGVDVTAAITKAFNQAKKNLIEVPIANGTISHEVEKKFKAAHIVLKPAKQGKGIICGGVVRVLAEMAGIHNMSGKILGTGNNVANAKCVMAAFADVRAPKASAKKAAAKVEAQPSVEAAPVAEAKPARKPAAKKATKSE